MCRQRITRVAGEVGHETTRTGFTCSNLEVGETDHSGAYLRNSAASDEEDVVAGVRQRSHTAFFLPAKLTSFLLEVTAEEFSLLSPAVVLPAYEVEANARDATVVAINTGFMASVLISSMSTRYVGNGSFIQSIWGGGRWWQGPVLEVQSRF